MTRASQGILFGNPALLKLGKGLDSMGRHPIPFKLKRQSRKGTSRC